MLAGRNRRAGMPDADGGIAGGFHDDVHRAAGDRARAVVGEGGRAIRAASQPTVRHASRARSRIEIDDDGHLEPRRVRHLRQEHRAEFSGADQRDADRFAGREAGVEEAMKVHGG